jgi:DHA3 family tetracycline resistance protein-like MFS transporter
MRAMTGKSRSSAPGARNPATRERPASSGTRLATRYRHDVSKAFRVLAERDFALLWGGQTASIIGDGVFTVALALETLRVSDHASTLSYVIAARVAPTVLLLLVAGALVDRLPRRFTVLTADAVRGLAIAALAALVVAHALTVADLIAISAVVGAADAFFFPAYQAIIPEIVPSALYLEGNAFNSASQVLGGALIGPAIGGMLIAAFGAASAFAVDAASFFASALCVAAMRARPAPRSSGKSMLADARAGLRWTRSQPWLWWTIVAASVANFAAFAPTQVLLPLLIRDTLHQGPTQYGLVFAAAGLGGATASVVAIRFGSPRRRVTVMWAGWAIGAVAIAGLGLAPDVALVAALGAVAFGLLQYGGMLWNTMMQQLVPPEMLGRASSVDWLLSMCLSPVGILVAGIAAASIGVRATLLAGGLISAAMAWVLFLPGVRDPERGLTAPAGAPGSGADAPSPAGT